MFALPVASSMPTPATVGTTPSADALAFQQALNIDCRFMPDEVPLAVPAKAPVEQAETPFDPAELTAAMVALVKDIVGSRVSGGNVDDQAGKLLANEKGEQHAGDNDGNPMSDAALVMAVMNGVLGSPIAQAADRAGKPLANEKGEQHAGDNDGNPMSDAALVMAVMNGVLGSPIAQAAKNQTSDDQSQAASTLDSSSIGVALPIARTGSLAQILPIVSEPLKAEFSPDSTPVHRQLDMTNDLKWLDRLAREIVTVGEQSNRLSFRLSPAHLGRLDLDILVTDSGLSLAFASSTDEAARQLTNAQPQLIQELRNRGLRVAEAQVNSGAADTHSQRQNDRPNHRLIEFSRGDSTPEQLVRRSKNNERFA